MLDDEPVLYSLTTDEAVVNDVVMDDHARMDPMMAYDTWIDVTVTEFGAITAMVANSEPPKFVLYEEFNDDDASDIAEMYRDFPTAHPKWVYGMSKVKASKELLIGSRNIRASFEETANESVSSFHTRAAA